MRSRTATATATATAIAGLLLSGTAAARAADVFNATLSPSWQSSPSAAPGTEAFGSHAGHRRVFNFKYKDDAGIFHVDGLTTGTSVPSLAVNGSDAPRRLVGVPTAAGSARLYGFGLALEHRADWATFAIFGVRYAASGAGPSGQADALANGSPVGVGHDAVHLLQISMPTFFFVPSGFQVIAPNSAYKVRFDYLDWGISHLWTTARLTDVSGAQTTGTASRWGAYLHASLAVCGSLGRWAPPLRAWGCVFAEPVVYDGATGWFSGMTLGARAEL